MSSREFQKALVEGSTKRAKEILQGTGNLPREDLEYVVNSLSRMKDERLQSCVAELIRWGDEERADLETLIAICLEAMKLCSPSKLRDAATRVEMRFHLIRGTHNV